jgi:hypothetical protein
MELGVEQTRDLGGDEHAATGEPENERGASFSIRQRACQLDACIFAITEDRAGKRRDTGHGFLPLKRARAETCEAETCA